MKKICQSTILISMALLLFTALLITSAFAAETESPRILKFEDGSYVVITIEEDQSPDGVSSLSGKRTKSGTKNYDYYNGSNKLVLTFRVHGTFEYDGVTASAIGASYSYDIYDSSWSFVDGNATYSGATATATGRFKRSPFPSSISVSLTCSPDGVLS